MNTIIQARIDADSKKEAEVILNQMGMSLNEGIRVFIRQVVNDRALPFQPRVSVFRDEVIEAAQRAQDYIEGKNREGFKSYSSVEELMADIERED